jgi:hypothetical protein
MSLEDYVAAQQRNLEAIRQSPHYSRLIETVDRMYRTTLDLGPAYCPRICFGKMLLMCHKSLLSAATLIARGQPEDSAPISRRAIEIGHLAIAVHLDSQNYVKWLDQERRMARNEARRKGERPKNDPGHKWGKEVLEHPLLTDLRTFLGMLSDHYAHFSPEFEGNLAWSEHIKPGEELTIQLEYFDTTKRTIHLAFVNLATIHLRLLEVFNACFNGGPGHDGGWRFLKETALAVAGELAQEFKPQHETSSQLRPA